MHEFQTPAVPDDPTMQVTPDGTENEPSPLPLPTVVDVPRPLTMVRPSTFGYCMSQAHSVATVANANQ